MNLVALTDRQKTSLIFGIELLLDSQDFHTTDANFTIEYDLKNILTKLREQKMQWKDGDNE